MNNLFAWRNPKLQSSISLKNEIHLTIRHFFIINTIIKLSFHSLYDCKFSRLSHILNHFQEYEIHMSVHRKFQRELTIDREKRGGHRPFGPKGDPRDHGTRRQATTRAGYGSVVDNYRRGWSCVRLEKWRATGQVGRRATARPRLAVDVEWRRPGYVPLPTYQRE